MTVGGGINSAKLSQVPLTPTNSIIKEEQRVLLTFNEVFNVYCSAYYAYWSFPHRLSSGTLIT